MQLLEQPPAGSGQVDCLIFGIVRPSSEEDESKQEAGWQTVVDQFTAWKQDPEILEDDGIEPPAAGILQNARDFAAALRTRGIEAPTTVIPNGDGGLVLRWKDGEVQWTVEFEDDGFVESYLTVGNKVRCRHGLQSAALSNHELIDESWRGTY